MYVALFLVPKGANDRKLYLFIEGKTQRAVNTAKLLIETVLKDELHAEATTYKARGNPNRYNVLAIGGGGPPRGQGALGWRR